MSRGYVVRWLTESQTVTAADHCKLDIDLLGILPEGDMIDLLERELVAAGWRETDEGLVAPEQDGAIVARLSPDGRSLEIRLSAQHTVKGTGTTQEEARRDATRAAQSSQGKLESQVAAALLRAEPAVRSQLQQVLQSVYIEALKKKAQSLGQLQSVQETRNADGEIEVVLKVRA
jgi:hypothetical protein